MGKEELWIDQIRMIWGGFPHVKMQLEIEDTQKW